MAATKDNPDERTVKLTRVVRKERDGKNGKWTSLGIQIENWEGWINGSQSDQNKNWEIGDTVSILVWSEKYTKDGEQKTAYKFKLPSDKVTRAEFQSVVDRVLRLELELSALKAGKHIVAEGEQVGDFPL
jgi:hypothetical protein